MSNKMTPDEKKRFMEARSAGGGNNMRHGIYVLMIDKWHFRRGFNGLTDIHEFIILNAEKNPVMHGDKRVEEEPNPVDSSVSVPFLYGGKTLKIAPVLTTQFLLKMLGLSDGEISDDDKESARIQCTNDDPAEGQVNPCRGMIIGCETMPYFAKESKQYIVRQTWKTISPINSGVNTVEEAAKRWAEYEARMKAKGTKTAA